MKARKLDIPALRGTAKRLYSKATKPHAYGMRYLAVLRCNWSFWRFPEGEEVSKYYPVSLFRSTSFCWLKFV